MIITYYRMTGSELRRIFNEAKLNNKKITLDNFADRIKVGRTSLYGLFKTGQIDDKQAEDIYKNIVADPELGKYRTLIKASADKSTDGTLPESSKGTVISAGQHPDLWDKALNMLNETLMMIRDDNKFIKEDAAIYRDMVKRAIEEGAIGPIKAHRK